MQGFSDRCRDIRNCQRIQIVAVESSAHFFAHLFQCRVVAQLRHLGQARPLVDRCLAQNPIDDIPFLLALPFQTRRCRCELVLSSAARSGVERNHFAGEFLPAGRALGEMSEIV